MVLALVLPYCSWFWQLLLVLPLKFRRKENCHCCWPKKYIAIGIAIDIGRINTLALLLPLILIWKKHCHCYWHWYCDMEKIAIDIAIDIVTGKILLLILSLVLLIPQPLLLLLPLEIWRPDNCYCYCSKNFAIAHVCKVLIRGRREYRHRLGTVNPGVPGLGFRLV